MKRSARKLSTTCIGGSSLLIFFRQFPSSRCECGNIDESTKLQVAINQCYCYSSYMNACCAECRHAHYIAYTKIYHVHNQISNIYNSHEFSFQCQLFSFKLVSLGSSYFICCILVYYMYHNAYSVTQLPVHCISSPSL